MNSSGELIAVVMMAYVVILFLIVAISSTEEGSHYD